MGVKPVKDYDKFVVRLPEGMREAIAERAKKNGRSMNAEIVQILEDSLQEDTHNPDGLTKIELEEVVKMQKDLLLKYHTAIEKGSEMMEEVRVALEKNNKTRP